MGNQATGHKPKATHLWTYQTWEGIQKGKENFWDYYRLQAKLAGISAEGKLRLEWLAFYFTVGKQHKTITTLHFGISRKCLRRWVKRFDRQNVFCLEEKAKRPRRLREWLDFSVIGLDDITESNSDLTEWLVKYNSVRPHQALDYKTPLAYASLHYPQLVPMYPAQTLVKLSYPLLL